MLENNYKCAPFTAAGYRCCVLSPIVLLILLVLSTVTPAYETAAILPSARAAAMAGMFSAQADDSSAIWYNPAGLNHPNRLNADYSMTLGKSAIGHPGQTVGDQHELLEGDNSLLFAAAYGKNFPVFNHSRGLDTGIAYLRTYNIRLNVDAPQSPLTSEPFGLIDAGYQQLSWMLGYRLNPTQSLGATLDLVWSDIECLQFHTCVSNPPLAPGWSVGVLTEAFASEYYKVNIGASYRSRARLQYATTASSGIGTVLEDYLPARPPVLALGLNMQVPSKWAFINVNFGMERVSWSKAQSRNTALTDYRNSGISTELLFTGDGDSSWALRAGYRRSLAENEAIMPSFKLVTAGVGYLFFRNHSVDLAMENRTLKGIDGDSNRSLIISYSYQY